jgi:hypothetical protein
MGIETAAREIGAKPASFSNAYHIEVGRRNGTVPAPRDTRGCLTPKGIERIRDHLRNGSFGWQIQQDCQVSAGLVSEQRRQYAAELKVKRKKPLPPPGAGVPYAGVRVPIAKKKEAEALFLEGWGTAKVSAKSGVSRTVCIRVRKALIQRLRKRGECLPGCDIDGVRRRYRDHARAVRPEQRVALRKLIIQRVPVRAAAKIVGMGGSNAYKERDALKAELEAQGKVLPPPVLRGSKGYPVPEKPLAESKRLISEAKGDLTVARRLEIEEDVLAAAAGDPGLEAQLRRLIAGARLVEKPVMRAASPDMTMGGVVGEINI